MSRRNVWTIPAGNQAIAAVHPHQQGLPARFHPPSWPCTLMEMANAELDHFENEEAFGCPIIGKKFSEEQQLSIVKLLLFDPNDDDPCWIID